MAAGMIEVGIGREMEYRGMVGGGKRRRLQLSMGVGVDREGRSSLGINGCGNRKEKRREGQWVRK